MLKKLLAITLTLALITAMMSACSDDAATSSTPASTPDSGSTETPADDDVANEVEPFEIDWFVNLSFWTHASDGWGVDMVSKQIMEKTGATVNFIVPATDGGEQLSTMINSGELSDLITIESWWSQTSRLLTHQQSQEG